MKKDFITLIGGSNSRSIKGIYGGIRRALVEHYAGHDDFSIKNLSLDGISTLGKIALVSRYKKFLSNNLFIVTENNVNDCHQAIAKKYKISIDNLKKEIFSYYNLLSSINKNVVSIILPYFFYDFDNIINQINNIHREACKFYGITICDIDNFYRQGGGEEFIC